MRLERIKELLHLYVRSNWSDSHYFFQSRFSQLKRKSLSGYTLIEILIVLLIISIVSGVVLITVRGQSQENVKTFQNDMVQILVFAKEQAILQPATLMIDFEQHSYQFFRYQAGIMGEKSHWVPLEGSILRSKSIPDNIAISVQLLQKKLDLQDQDDEQNVHTRIVFSSNGNITPFKMYVGQQGKKFQYLITGDEDGNVMSKELP
jgi:general secretion pathway protein H